MMDTVLASLAQNIPAAIALIIVVAYFLKAIDRIISQFQQILTEEKQAQQNLATSWQKVFDSQREALNLISAHIKQLSEVMIQHDGWEREVTEQILDNQKNAITRKIKNATAGKKGTP